MDHAAAPQPYWNGNEPEPVNPHPVYHGGPCPECGAPKGHESPWCYSYDIAAGPKEA